MCHGGVSVLGDKRGRYASRTFCMDKKPAKPSCSGAGSIRTLSDLDRWTGPESDSDDEDAPEYDMLVQDPTKGNDVDAIFNQARQLGAVGDGPLRRLDDPENASFLESIRKSECPKELEPADRRSSVHDNLTRRDQNCPAWGCSELSAAVDGIPSEASYLSNSQKIEQADLSSLVVIQKL
ncbi:hypothetical protein D5086_007738 [Populus alba]|uniref:Uncharacterized protein n=1 Tax=Populus alba TaxID=43335 RepID=A0ACC4CEG0_POPAL